MAKYTSAGKTRPAAQKPITQMFKVDPGTYRKVRIKEVSDGVRSAGFRANDLRGAELVDYAGKVSEKALSAAGHAVDRRSKR